MKILQLLAFAAYLLPTMAAFSQTIQDDFSDGDFTQNPVWVGDAARFTVNASGRLQTNGTANDTIGLSTAFALPAGTAEWRIDAAFSIAPSTANLVRIYLMSDKATLTASLNGYFIQMGETGSTDGIHLYRQDGTAVTKILSGATGTVATGANLRLRVVRSSAGAWDIQRDLAGGNVFVSEGAVTDAKYTACSAMGVYVRHTSTNTTRFSFDNIYAGNLQIDTQPPVVLNAVAQSAQSVLVSFNELLATVSAQTPANYTLNSGATANMATLVTGDSTKVKIDFAGNFQNNTAYTLSVKNVADRKGNIIPIGSPQTTTFLYFQPEIPAANDVVINEIMADPTPVVGLPDAEWVELYNRSSKVFDLSGWTLGGSALPSYILAPNSYVVVCAAADSAETKPFGNRIYPQTWNSLTNSGEGFSLRGKTNVLIDSVVYSDKWYQENSKKEGGWTLERINPAPNGCPAATNWAAAIAVAGGTPNAQNSIFSTDPDLAAPLPYEALVLSSDTIAVRFDEPMSEASLAQTANYTLTGGFSIVQAIPQLPDLREVRLIPSASLPDGNTYTLTIQNAADCAGNVMTAPANFPLVLATPAKAGEIVFTEIFPDPTPSIGLPEREFVEIYNRTDKPLSIFRWKISVGNSAATLPDAVLAPRSYAIICNAADASLFSPYGQILTVSSLSALTNSRDSLFLQDAANNIMDYVIYDISWYLDSKKSDGGYSLEKIDANLLDCNNAGNWQASQALKGGTPATQNSIAGIFADAQPPIVAQASISPDQQSLLLTFSEPMDAATLGLLLHFSGNNGLGEAKSVTVSDLNRTEAVIRFGKNFATDTIYEVSIFGLTDCTGNAISDTLLRVGVGSAPAVGDILLSEVLFNPYSGGSDFVEIYNNSDKYISLSTIFIGTPAADGWQNTAALTRNQSLLAPKQYLALTPNTADVRSRYAPPVQANLLEISALPSMADNAGSIGIWTFNGTDTLSLDVFSYQDDYHSPFLTDKNGVSLERIAWNVPTQQSDNWHSAASTVGYASPGYANSQRVDVSDTRQEVSLEYTTFTPNGDGDKDVLPIRYDFDFQGGNALITAFNAAGQPVKTIKENILLGTQSGTFFWDGKTDSGGMAPVGIYIILVEITRENGKNGVYKLVCVLGDRL